jgi:hypothetical protein
VEKRNTPEIFWGLLSCETWSFLDDEDTRQSLLVYDAV